MQGIESFIIYLSKLTGSDAAGLLEAPNKIACIRNSDLESHLSDRHFALVEQQSFRIIQLAAHYKLVRSAAELGFEPVAERAVADMQ